MGTGNDPRPIPTTSSCQGSPPVPAENGVKMRVFQIDASSSETHPR